MGCFGYICKGCGSSIRGDCWDGGEKAILIHVRHGEEMGRVEGHYDEYGRVIEQKDLPEDEKFRGMHSGINGHSEICNSGFMLDDSYDKVKEKRVYAGREVTFYSYISRIISDEVLANYDDVRKSGLYKYVLEESKDAIEVEIKESGKTSSGLVLAEFKIGLEYLAYDKDNEFYKDFMELDIVERDKYSGIVAWHSLCYKKANECEKNDLTPSELDPNQSWGKVRKKYI